MLDQLVGPLVDLWGEDRYSGVAGFIDAQVDIDADQLAGAHGEEHKDLLLLPDYQLFVICHIIV